VEPTNYATWLDATKSADGSLLRPYAAEAMTATAVSTYVNHAQHQGPECIADEAPSFYGRILLPSV
jgi:putative SOS response-associated peptidase YedK